MSIVKRLGGSGAAKVRLLFGLCKDFEEKMCKVSAKKQVYLFFLPSRSHFYAKSVEMEVIFNSCWVLEIQNEVSTNLNCLHVYIWFLHSGSSCQLPNGKPIERVCISGLSFTSLTNASVKSELGTMLCSIYAR